MANSKNLITGKKNTKPVEPVKPESEEDLRAQLEAMKVELANAQAKGKRETGELTLKVSQKGCVSVYGMGRFPQSLYKSQWTRLAKEMPRILEFIKENDSILPDKKAAAPKK